MRRSEAKPSPAAVEAACSNAPSRRDALRAGALAAGALAAGGLVRPPRAAGQASTDTEELRDFLAEAVAREQISALAYAEAGQVGNIEPELERTLERFRKQEQAHVNALTSALESIGFDAPEAPSDPADDGVFQDVDGIDDDIASALGNRLATLADPKTEDQHLELLIELERGQIGFYSGGVPPLDSEDMRTTCAQIAANAAQHLVVLRLATGLSLAKALDTRADAGGQQKE